MDISTNGSNSGVYLFDLDWNLGFGKRVGEKKEKITEKKPEILVIVIIVSEDLWRLQSFRGLNQELILARSPWGTCKH